MVSDISQFLPALNNPYAFYAVAGLALAVVCISAASLYVGPGASGRSILRWPRLVVAVCFWLLLTFWLVSGAGISAFAGAVGGSLIIPLLALGLGITLLIGFSLVMLAWSLRRRWAEWFLIGTGALTFSGVIAFQRLWICEPLAAGGWTAAAMCTAAAGTESGLSEIESIPAFTRKPANSG